MRKRKKKKIFQKHNLSTPPPAPVFVVHRLELEEQNCSWFLVVDPPKKKLLIFSMQSCPAYKVLKSKPSSSENSGRGEKTRRKMHHRAFEKDTPFFFVFVFQPCF